MEDDRILRGARSFSFIEYNSIKYGSNRISNRINVFLDYNGVCAGFRYMIKRYDRK